MVLKVLGTRFWHAEARRRREDEVFKFGDLESISNNGQFKCHPAFFQERLL